MQENEIINRIKQLCKARSWTYYRLAKASGITYSTLCTMIHKANYPSVPTLIKICDGFGITVGEFFDENNTSVSVSTEEKAFLKKWNELSLSNQIIAEKYIDFLISEQIDKKKIINNDKKLLTNSKC